MSSETAPHRRPSRGSVPLIVLLGGLAVAGIPSVVTQWSQRTAAVAAAAEATNRLERARAEATLVSDSLEAERRVAPSPVVPTGEPYIVVSADARWLWLRQGDSVLFEAGVAVGKGDVTGNGSFATPRRRFLVLKKETAPQWVPPDWHYQEYAASRGLSMTRLDASSTVQVGDATIRVDGGDVVKVLPDGAVERFAPGKEVVVGGQVIIPPFGTRQRSYGSVLGAYRLNFGNGYAIHGTNQPASIGRAASHGCIRMRNEDISKLVGLVDVGTAVYVY